MTRIATFDQAMAAIWERSGYDRGFISNPFAGDDAARLGLVRTARVLDLLGNPERDYAIVHVAGSKGKGSTSTFIDSIVRASGRKSGRFLSPHLHSYQERFVVDDRPIDEATFTRLVADVLDAALDAERSDPGMGQLTAWELSTAMALLRFSRAECQLAVIEVGLGGTLDATNVVDPAVSVITSLDYEHTAILGSTMTEIAANKAGIIKPGKPAVVAHVPNDARAVIEAKAAAVQASLRLANQDWTVTGADRGFSVSGWGWRHDRLTSSLAGRHQVDNAGLAIAAAHELIDRGLLLGRTADKYIREGVRTATLPGRFEVVPHPSGVTFVVDGAHSPASMTALATTVRDRFPSSTVTVVLGMLADKDPDALIGPLAEVASRWLVAPPGSPRAMPGANVVARLQARDLAADAMGSVGEAIHRLTGEPSDPSPVVVVTGSLSTVAEARVALGLA